jgi:NADPH:quinone reductase-like Zn-dependent oxidoreductase
MKAVVLTGYGEVENLVLREVEEPQPGPGQIKVKVAGASINPVDWKVRRGELRGLMPVELPTILGRDVSGEVVALGQGVTQFQVGDRVMGLVEHGYAELAVGQAAAFAKLPPELELEPAGALPLVGLTGAQLVEEAVDARPGQTVLVTGAVGSVGRVAVFAAKRRGAHVIAGVRARQRAAAEELEPDAIVALDQPAEVRRLHPVDAIADTVDGKLVESLLMKVKAGGVIGTVLNPPEGAEQRRIHVKAMLTHPDARRLSELGQAVVKGELVLPVDQRFPLHEARQGQVLAEGGGIGKVLLVPTGATSHAIEQGPG